MNLRFTRRRVSELFEHWNGSEILPAWISPQDATPHRPKVARTHSNDRNAVCLEIWATTASCRTKDLRPSRLENMALTVLLVWAAKASRLWMYMAIASALAAISPSLQVLRIVAMQVSWKKTSSNTKELPQYLNTHRSKNHKLMRSTVNTPSDQILLKARYIKGATATAACKMNFMKIQTSNWLTTVHQHLPRGANSSLRDGKLTTFRNHLTPKLEGAGM